MSESDLRLNLGCGEQTPAGWQNLDSSPGARLASWPRLVRSLSALLPPRFVPAKSWQGANVRWMELTRRWPLSDGCASVIYSSHFLENLELEEARHVLREAARVLRPKGRIRIVVPDLEALVGLYQEEKKEKPAEAAAHFLRNTGFFVMPAPRGLLSSLIYRIQRRHNHQLLHDEGWLRAELERAGFEDLVRCELGESEIPGVEELDTPERFENALCLEGRRA